MQLFSVYSVHCTVGPYRVCWAASVVYEAMVSVGVSEKSSFCTLVLASLMKNPRGKGNVDEFYSILFKNHSEPMIYNLK